MRSELPPVRPLFLWLLSGASILALPSVGAASETFGKSWPGTRAANVTAVAGVSRSPDYIGSDDYKLTTDLVVRGVSGGRYAEFSHREHEGTRIELDMMSSPSFDAGPILMRRAGRSGVEDVSVNKFAAIDAAWEIGGFLQSRRENLWRAGDFGSLRAETTLDFSGVHDGLVGELGASYGAPVWKDVKLNSKLAVSFGSGSYMDVFFGVSGDNAAASGLPQREASMSLRDVRLNFNLSYAFDRTITAYTNLGYSLMLGDAADSPIVADRGQKGAFLFGFGAGINF